MSSCLKIQDQCLDAWPFIKKLGYLATFEATRPRYGGKIGTHCRNNPIATQRYLDKRTWLVTLLPTITEVEKNKETHLAHFLLPWLWEEKPNYFQTKTNCCEGTIRKLVGSGTDISLGLQEMPQEKHLGTTKKVEDMKNLWKMTSFFQFLRSDEFHDLNVNPMAMGYRLLFGRGGFWPRKVMLIATKMENLHVFLGSSWVFCLRIFSPMPSVQISEWYLVYSTSTQNATSLG